jgi:hypothetical protein
MVKMAKRANVQKTNSKGMCVIFSIKK